MTKNYSVNMENDEVVSVEVDGVQYASPDEIPDAQDRDKINLLISRTEGEEFDDAFDENFDREFEEEFRELQRETAGFPKLIVAIFLGVAGIMLGIAAFSGYHALRTQSREQSAPGRVVDLVVRRTREGSTNEIKEYTYPVVEFSVPGQPPQTVQMSEGSWPPAYAVGDQVTVLYDPQQPRVSRIKSFSSTLLLWLLPGITAMVGAAFVAATLFVFKMSPTSKNEPESSLI